VRVIAADDVGLTSVELRVDGKPVELAPDGTARVYFSAPGNGRLEARAFDAAGNVGTALGRVSMRSGEEDGGGQAQILSWIRRDKHGKPGSQAEVLTLRVCHNCDRAGRCRARNVVGSVKAGTRYGKEQVTRQYVV
jgi:hypothetical protein